MHTLLTNGEGAETEGPVTRAPAQEQGGPIARRPCISNQECGCAVERSKGGVRSTLSGNTLLNRDG
jgi:hypothetical protein